ncbi:MAG: DUF1493 family protein [Paraglaciecola sp.]|uniref:DUF1493 family protein n=1 Tax=Paraglaciecola sp. TaxID=1920173 RepID=UPI003298BA97
MITIDEIFKFIESECGVGKEKIASNADIFDDLGIAGDDFSELIENYATSFNVNMDDYLWYFHNTDEGVNIWRFIFKPPNKNVSRIAITPQLLLDCANTRKWNIDYPQHDIPKNRNDLIYSNLLWVMILVLLFLLAKTFN